MIANILKSRSSKLSEVAMLVCLNVSQWTARKYDRAVSDSTAAKYGAKLGSGRFNKVLVAKEAILNVTKAVGAARTFFHKNTLAWNDDGTRILPAANFETFSSKMRELRADFDAQVARFCDSYPALRTAAKNDLGEMYNELDYPETWRIRGKFNFDIAVLPTPSSDDFRITLQEEDMQAIREDLEARTKKILEEATLDLWRRLHGVVERMVDRLSDPDAVFRDSLVENVRELVGLLPRLNITGDADLEHLRKEAEAKLAKYDPDNLRDSKTIRASVVQDAKDLMGKMAGYMNPNPIVKIEENSDDPDAKAC